MIQLNLLPDVKLEYLKAQRMRRLAMVVSVIVSVAAVVLLVLLLAVETYQKHTLNNLNNDVVAKTSQFQNEPHIGDVLTIQNQLQSLNTLHANEPATTRLFDYLNELTPTTVTIGTLAVDFNGGTISLSGQADSISTINQFVDTLKFTKYTTGSNTPSVLAFSNVVLSSFGQSSQSSSGALPASYSIAANFDPTIFNATKNVSLIIPNIVTTRSSLENPGPLFVQEPSSHTTSSSSSNSSGGSH